MEEKPFLRNRLILRRLIHQQAFAGIRSPIPTRRRPIKRVGYEWGDGAEDQAREVQEARGENLGVSGGRIEPESGYEGADPEVLEAVAALVELGGLGFGGGSDWGDRVLGL